MKVLIIGGGGREHALAWKTAQSNSVSHVYVAPGNAGSATEHKVSNISIEADDIAALIEFAQKEDIDEPPCAKRRHRKNKEEQSRVEFLGTPGLPHWQMASERKDFPYKDCSKHPRTRKAPGKATGPGHFENQTNKHNRN